MLSACLGQLSQRRLARLASRRHLLQLGVFRLEFEQALGIRHLHAAVRPPGRQPLTLTVLRNRFEKAKKLAGVEFQFLDIRAKAATDTGDLAHSQKLLAHKNRGMTEHYVRARIGERVRPLR